MPRHAVQVLSMLACAAAYIIMPSHHKLSISTVVDASWCSAISLSSSDAWCRMSCGNTPPDCPVDMCSCPAEEPEQVIAAPGDTNETQPTGRTGKMVFKNMKTAKIEELQGGKLNDCSDISDENTCVNSYRWVFGASTMTSSGLSYGCTFFNNHECIRKEDPNAPKATGELAEGFNQTAPAAAPAAKAEPVVMSPMMQLTACLEESITPSDVRACRAAADRVPASAIATPAQPTGSKSSAAAYSSQQEEQQSNATSSNSTSPKPVVTEETHARRTKAAKNKMDRQWRRAQAAPCSSCGFGNGVPNCCSHGGAWAGSCTVTEEDGGEHTWEEGFNACFGTPLPSDGKLEELQKTVPKQVVGEHTTGGPKQRLTPEFDAMPKDLNRKLPALEDLPSEPEPEADTKTLGEAMAGKHITVDAPAAVNPYKVAPEGTEDAKAPDDQTVPAGDGKGLPDLKLPDVGKLPDVNIPEQESESGDLVKAFKREMPDVPELSNETSASAATATADAAKPSSSSPSSPSPSSSDPTSKSAPPAVKAADPKGEKPLLRTDAKRHTGTHNPSPHVAAAKGEEQDTGGLFKQAPAESKSACPRCGYNDEGVANCCSSGGAWADKCTVSLSGGGEHTWIQGFEACSSAQRDLDSQAEEVVQREEFVHEGTDFMAVGRPATSDPLPPLDEIIPKEKVLRHTKEEDLAACPKCGKNADGVANCCSSKGSWEGKCTALLSEGGKHTWEEGYNVCELAEKAIKDAKAGTLNKPLPSLEEIAPKKKEKEEDWSLKDNGAWDGKRGINPKADAMADTAAEAERIYQDMLTPKTKRNSIKVDRQEEKVAQQQQSDQSDQQAEYSPSDPRWHPSAEEDEGASWEAEAIAKASSKTETEEEFAEEEVYVEPAEPGAAIEGDGGGADSPFKDGGDGSVVAPDGADPAPLVRKLKAAPAKPVKEKGPATLGEMSNPDRADDLSEMEAMRLSNRREVHDERLPAVVGGDGSLVTCSGEDALLGGCYGQERKPQQDEDDNGPRMTLGQILKEAPPEDEPTLADLQPAESEDDYVDPDAEEAAPVIVPEESKDVNAGSVWDAPEQKPGGMSGYSVSPMASSGSGSGSEAGRRRRAKHAAAVAARSSSSSSSSKLAHMGNAHKKAMSSEEAVNLATVVPRGPGGADDRAPLSVGDDRDSPPRTDLAPEGESDDALQPKGLGGRHQSMPQAESLSAEEMREVTSDFKDFTREHAPAPKPTSRRARLQSGLDRKAAKLVSGGKAPGGKPSQSDDGRRALRE